MTDSENPASEVRDYAERRGVSMRKALMHAKVCDISSFYRWVQKGDGPAGKLRAICRAIDELAEQSAQAA